MGFWVDLWHISNIHLRFQHVSAYENGNYDFESSGDASRDLYVSQMVLYTPCGHSIFTAALIKRTHDALAEVISDITERTSTNVSKFSNIEFFVRSRVLTRYCLKTVYFYFATVRVCVRSTRLQVFFISNFCAQKFTKGWKFP